MAGECGEIDLERSEVHRLMRHRLAGVQHCQRTHGLGPTNQFGHRRARPGHIGMMGERNDFHPFVECQRIQIKLAVISDAVPPQGRSGAPGQLLPGDQVGVVFKFGRDNHVARTDDMSRPIITENVGHEIECLGGVLGEYHFVRRGPDESRDIGPARLEGVGGFFHQLMSTAMHRTVRRGEELPLGIEHLQRFLRRRPRIEIGQLFSTAHHPIQNREIRANPIQIGAVELDRDSHTPRTRRSYAL